MASPLPGLPTRFFLPQRILEILTVVCVLVQAPRADAAAPDRTRPGGAATDSSWWTQLTPTGVPPAARSAPSAILDPIRRRMILFGGYNGTRLNDTWALNLDGPRAWTELTPTGGPPPARSVHTAIYDPVRDRMIVFGGTSNSTAHYSGDVWALSLAGQPQWTELPPTIAPRASHSAIYDPIGDRMVVFGGRDLFNIFGEVWSLSLAGTPEWQQLFPAGSAPGPLDAHGAVYDPANEAMIVFGGVDALSTAHNDVWSLSLSGTPTWSKLSPSGTLPSARGASAMVYDTNHGRILVNGTCFLNDAWALETLGLLAWVSATPTGTQPAARCSRVAIYDDVSDRMVTFGGGNGSQYFNDTWEFHWCSPCVPTAAAVSLDAKVDVGGVVHLTWSRPDPGALITIERRETGTEWATLASIGVDPEGKLSYEDHSVGAGRTYGYRLLIQSGAESYWTNELWVTTGGGLSRPESWLAPGHPNPSGGETQLSMYLTRDGTVRLRIYDVLGRRVRTLVDRGEPAGWRSARWDGKDERGAPVPSGIYVARLEAEGRIQARKIVVAR